MLLNLTNHPVNHWPDTQRAEAERRWGEIIDLPFPAVDPQAPICAVSAQARNIVQEAAARQPDAVLCQGEMTMTMALVLYFQMEEIPTYAACSQREATVRKDENGDIRKNSCFRFVRFRAYPKF